MDAEVVRVAVKKEADDEDEKVAPPPESEEDQLCDDGDGLGTDAKHVVEPDKEPHVELGEASHPRSKLSIKHIDLLFETKQNKMQCRMCLCVFPF
jgi:hypothetical protein